MDISKIKTIDKAPAGKKKKIIIGLGMMLVLFFVIYFLILPKKSAGGVEKLDSQVVNIDKSFIFPALDDKGKTTKNKVNLKISKVEKTNQVLVKDQAFSAKNNKMFLILHLELKNDLTNQMNILPGDLIRLAYEQDKENKFAPDLHNNLVAIAAISTKLDRVGFVVSDDVKKYFLSVGELEGKKEEIPVEFSY